MTEKKKRLEQLDLVKALGIIFVVYNHASMLPEKSIVGNLLMSISYGAVPCFMMVSGGLMHQQKELDWKKLVRKVIHIYLLLVFWRGCYLLFYQYWYPAEHTFAETLRYFFLFGSLPNVNAGLFWYLDAYLFACVCYPITHRLFGDGRSGRMGLFAVAVATFCMKPAISVWEILSGNTYTGVVTSYLQNATLFYYFVIGAFLFAYRERIRAFMVHKFHATYVPALLMVLGAVGLMLEKYGQTGSFCWEGVHISGVYYRMTTMLLSLGIYLVILYLPSNRPMQFFARQIGPYTMGIYVMHGILVPWLQIIIREYTTLEASLGLQLVIVAVVVLTCTILTRIMRSIPGVRIFVS